MARINELQKIAQDLGAKHFKVTYVEEKAVFNELKSKAGAKFAKEKAEASHNVKSLSNTHTEIAAEMECPGHSPVRPKLRYLNRDQSIQTLIEMRMDELAPLTHQVITLKFSNSSGIKESDAVKIDAVLKGLKCSGNASVVNEVKNEMRKYFEYEIDF